MAITLCNLAVILYKKGDTTESVEKMRASYLMFRNLYTSNLDHPKIKNLESFLIDMGCSINLNALRHIFHCFMARNHKYKFSSLKLHRCLFCGLRPVLNACPRVCICPPIVILLAFCKSLEFGNSGGHPQNPAKDRKLTVVMDAHEPNDNGDVVIESNTLAAEEDDVTPIRAAP